MKRKAVILFGSLFLLLTTTFQSANALGPDESQVDLNEAAKINVDVDGSPVSDPVVPNLIVEGRTIVPLKSFADLVGAFIQGYSNDRVQIVKPNVNIIVSKVTKEKDQYMAPLFFYAINKVKVSLDLYYFIDNAPLTSELYSKIVVLDPNDNVVYEGEMDPYNTKQKGTTFAGIRTLKEIDFNQKGNYTFQFLMKAGKGGEYIKTGQTSIKVE